MWAYLINLRLVKKPFIPTKFEWGIIISVMALFMIQTVSFVPWSPLLLIILIPTTMTGLKRGGVCI